MKEIICNTPLFGLALSIIAYLVGIYINKISKLAILNPLVISYILIIAILVTFDIPLEYYYLGANIINLCLGPVTATLALNIYRQRDLIKKYFLPIVVGTLVGSIISLTSIFILCRIFNLTETVTASIIPKGITTALALAVCTSLGGNEAITIICVTITGFTGYFLAPYYYKLMKIDDPITQGVALGTTSHAIGTTKAVELGEKQAAASSVALTFTGFITVLMALVFSNCF